MNKQLIFSLTLWSLIILNVTPPILYPFQIIDFPILFGQLDAITITGLFFLLWFGRNELADYHIDKLTIYLMLIAAGVLIIFSRSFAVVVLFFLLILFFGRKVIRIELMNAFSSLDIQNNRFLIKIIIGILTGTIFTLVVVYPVFGNISLKMLGFEFVLELGKAAVNEEVLLRGFLWGYLKRHSWKDSNIFFFQAILFFLAHYHQYQTVWWLWISSLLAGLLFGMLAWRFRSVTPSIIAHAVINALITLP